MKERFIELIQEAVGGCSRYWAELIANNLLDHGAILPPIGLGDTVYCILVGDNGEYVSKQIVTGIDIRDTGVKTRCRFNVFSQNEWGKYIFLFREDAEKVLAERSNQ